MTMMRALSLLSASSGALSTSEAFRPVPPSTALRGAGPLHPRRPGPRRATYTPVFDFTLADPAAKRKSAASFERIDDAIMGGISLSALRDVPDEPFASWSGVCRTDGGGFCGMRTRAFAAPLDAAGQAGAYLDCRLASDDEADRRVWKMSLRTDGGRGEVVYQAEYDLRAAMEDAGDDGNGWARVRIPFDQFNLVRGPRLVPDGPALNATGGIFQIGMTLSKFKMGRNTTELENFRAGFFDLHVQRMGFYSNDEAATTGSAAAEVPDTLSEREAAKKRPLLLKVLLPVAKLFFSEEARRRKSAMRILREERGLSRGQAILFGVRSRQHMGRMASALKTLGILSADASRTVAFSCLKVALLYPLRALRTIVRGVRRLFGMKVNPPLRE